MSIEDIRAYCLSLPYAEETMPFDDTTIVYKVGGKWFAVTDVQFINEHQTRLYGHPGAAMFTLPAPLLPELQKTEVRCCGRICKSMDFTDGVLTALF